MIGGASNSQHLLGEALEIQGIGKVKNAQIFEYVRSNLKYQQLIWEYGNSINPRWVHVGYSPNGNKNNQVFSLPKGLKIF